MKKRSGSAVLIVIGIMIVLAVIATFTLSNKSQRANFTVFMSNEAKVEAVCEAVLELAAREIHAKANKKGDEIFEMLRKPLPASIDNPIINIGGEGNRPKVKINKSIYSKVLDNFTNDLKKEGFEAITINEEDVTAEICYAETFADPNYPVVGVDIAPNVPNLPQIDIDTLKEDWHIPFMYPPNGPENNNHDVIWNHAPKNPGSFRFLGSDYAYISPFFDLFLESRSKIIQWIIPDRLSVGLFLKKAGIGVADSRSSFAVGVKLDDDTVNQLNSLTNTQVGNLDEYNALKAKHDAYLKQEADKAAAAAKDDDDDDDEDDEDDDNNKPSQPEIVWTSAEQNRLTELESNLGDLQDVNAVINENDSKKQEGASWMEVMVNSYLKSDDLVFDVKDKKVTIVDNGRMDLEKLLIDLLPAFNSLAAITPRELKKKLMGRDLKPVYKDLNKNNNFKEGEYIEKGGLLLVKCKVTGKLKNKKKPIEKTLVAELPFKVSDIAPIAPKHSFFLANSKCLYNVDSFTPKKINLNKVIPEDEKDTFDTKYDYSKEGVKEGGVLDECFMVTSLNHCKATDQQIRKSMISKQSLDSKGSGMLPYNVANQVTPSAGRIRILGECEPLNLYCGGLREGIEQNELTGIVSTSSNDSESEKLSTKATFAMTSQKEPDGAKQFRNNIMKIHFPILTPDGRAFNKAEGDGLMEGLTKIFDSTESAIGDLYTRPSLLFGKAHMAYPMGYSVEGNIGMNISEIQIIVNPTMTLNVGLKGLSPVVEPKGHWDKDFKVFYEIKNTPKYEKVFKSHSFIGKEIPYGLPNVSGGESILKQWDPTKIGQMPENIFTLEQYQKKASRYYDKEKYFIEDCEKTVKEGGLKNDDGTICCDGVIYIEVEGDEQVQSLSGKKFKGNGLIIARNFKINDDIKIEGDDSSLGIIAREGFLEISECNIEGSYYSDLPPVLTNANIIGNLVVNQLSRETTRGLVNVVYNTKHILPPCDEATSTDYSKRFEKNNPRRYYVSMADNWSASYYDKEKK